MGRMVFCENVKGSKCKTLLPVYVFSIFKESPVRVKYADNCDKRAYKRIIIDVFNREQFAFFFTYPLNLRYIVKFYHKQDLDF
ncbi:hypothetical protein L1987_42348 [Smallanthus sonchifolius]|uniref:Uncharacterized protein n=1 Tax=Smallanthus sonchifolius TaxID=185202 RepID=A0ACB9GJK7_9ASTR|nr:hypothetical protein L1987_42348 [Smallanthus sonchifolius]